MADDGIGERRWGRIVGLSLAIVFLLAIAVGFIGAHLEHGGGVDILVLIVLGVVLLCIVGCGWLIRRELSAPRPKLGPGEAAEHALDRRWKGLLILSCLFGALSAAAATLATGGESSIFAGALPASVAIILAVTWLALMIGASWFTLRHFDEVEIHNNLWGMAIGGSVVLIGYPAWYILWRGDLVPEPTHELVFLALFVASIAVYLWKKLR